MDQEYAKIGFPLAMKVVSPDIIHKSDTGGIELGLNDARRLSKPMKKL